MTKPATQWFNPNRNGTYAIGTSSNLVTNAGDFLVTNAGDFLITNSVTITPQAPSAWTVSSKNDTAWIKLSSTSGTVYSIADPSANLLNDPSGNSVVDTGVGINVTPATAWTEV